MAPATIPITKKNFKVDSENVEYSEDFIHSNYVYRDSKVTADPSGSMTVTPTEKVYKFKVARKLPKLGLMIVGWGGNNGSTVTASILANKQKLSWHTKEGIQQPNYYGSVTQASTFKIGTDQSGKDIYVPFSSMLPMVDPNDLVISGWDISSANLGNAMARAKVLEYDLQRQLFEQMSEMKPLPSIYYPDFIAANQAQRADNVLTGSKFDNLEQIRKDIRDFKSKHQLDKVIVLWSANTERFSDIIPGINDTSANLMKAVKSGHSEVAPSTIFAMASIMEGSPFINGSPQNTFVPGCIELAQERKIFIGGDDFKSGQTKMKSVLVDFLVNAGIKPISIASYNHLGNNDGYNLSAPQQFRSKEISKSNVVDDMVEANQILYKPGEHPDHIVVIKYVPAVADSKRALDEYVSEIFMGGRSTISIYNVCEDSLLASPLIIDLTILCELFTRIEYQTDETEGYVPFHSVLSILSYLLKAPLVPEGTPVVNALSKQRTAIENILRACIGLPPNSEMALEHHSGTFHADESLAVFMLKTLDEFKGANVVRTRDESIIEKADIVVDVGGVYDSSKCRFDHHQRGFEETFDANHKIKLSSAGLIYKHYGHQVIAQLLNWPLDHQDLPFLYEKVYDSLIEMFDGVDNGVEQYPEGVEAAYSDSTSISARVRRLNPRWNEETNSAILDAQFQKAVGITGEELIACVHNIALSWLPARDIVKQGFEHRKEVDPSGKIILLPQYCPFKSHLFDLEQELGISKGDLPLYVIFEDTSSTWRVQAVPVSPDSFLTRKGLPEPWRGVRDADLSKLTGVEGCIFVHASGFIGGANSKASALRLAKLALEHP